MVRVLTRGVRGGSDQKVAAVAAAAATALSDGITADSMYFQAPAAPKGEADSKGKQPKSNGDKKGKYDTSFRVGGKKKVQCCCCVRLLHYASDPCISVASFRRYYCKALSAAVSHFAVSVA